MNYFIYDTTTGAVKSKHVGTTVFVALDTGEGIIEGDINTKTHYVDVAAQTVIPRPTLSYSINKTTLVADAVDQIDITGLPDNTQVTWPDGETTHENAASFTLDLAGEYSVFLEKWPYLTEVINVTATDPT